MPHRPFPDPHGRTARPRSLTTSTRLRLGIAALLGAILAVPAAGLAQSASASYQLTRQSIDGGAGRAIGATYTVTGSVGQHDAGAPATSASFAIRGGFHRAAVAERQDRVFADGFEASPGVVQRAR